MFLQGGFFYLKKNSLLAIINQISNLNQILFSIYYTMKTTTISEIYKDYEKLINNNLNINGRVRTIRDSKTFGFIELNDGSYLKNIQIVFENNLNNFDEICKLSV